MKSVLILHVLLALAAQINCGRVYGGISSGFTPSFSSALYSRGYRSGTDLASSVNNGLRGYDLSGKQSFESSGFSTGADIVGEGRIQGAFNADGLGSGINGAEFSNTGVVGIGLRSNVGTAYQQQTSTVNFPIPKPFTLNRSVPIPISIPVREPSQEPIPVQYRVEVARPYPTPVQQTVDFNLPASVNVQTDASGAGGAFGFVNGIDSGRGFDVRSEYGLEREILGGIETGIRGGSSRDYSGVNPVVYPGSTYSDVNSRGWNPKWNYNGGLKY